MARNDSTRERITRRRFMGAAASVPVLSWAARSHSAADDGFRPLFDGWTLDGWHKYAGSGSHGTGGLWQVKDGVLTGEQDPPGSGNGGLFLSDAKFGDFELKIDMRPDWGPDSGIFFRCTEAGAGFQSYVDYHDRGNVGHLRGEMPGAFAMKPFQIFGVLDDKGHVTSFTTKPDPRAEKWPEGVYEYSCTPEQWVEAWRPGGWNTARIRCIGKYPEITVWINDLKVCCFNSETTTMPKHDKEHVYDSLGRAGSIGLQVHGGKSWPKGAKCRWKNILIKEL